MGEGVVVPGRVDRSASLGGEHGIAAGDLLVHHRVHPLQARLRAHGVQEQQRGAVELAADLALVGPELFDDLAVPVGHPPALNSASYVATMLPAFDAAPAVRRYPIACVTAQPHRHTKFTPMAAGAADGTTGWYVLSPHHYPHRTGSELGKFMALYIYHV